MLIIYVKSKGYYYIFKMIILGIKSSFLLNPFLNINPIVYIFNINRKEILSSLNIIYSL
jgi:hypothetical protein